MSVHSPFMCAPHVHHVRDLLFVRFSILVRSIVSVLLSICTSIVLVSMCYYSV